MITSASSSPLQLGPPLICRMTPCQPSGLQSSTTSTSRPHHTATYLRTKTLRLSSQRADETCTRARANALCRLCSSVVCLPYHLPPPRPLPLVISSSLTNVPGVSTGVAKFLCWFQQYKQTLQKGIRLLYRCHVSSDDRHPL